MAATWASFCTTYLAIQAFYNNLQIERTKRLLLISSLEEASCSVQNRPLPREEKSDLQICLQKQLFTLLLLSWEEDHINTITA
ncbi:hypothetical protein XELAEV_18047191mg [Xenopus laevis]|uniref:Uncharacterized protein n=1 Tax=Xenopus laevis TaxID=8355 RepID=A0A974BVE2_XENLA|nr:hypothetical protein XELAEV_18047191mg [Xenopus laevis]